MATAEAQRRWRAKNGARTGVPGRPAEAACGTLAAYKRHVRHREPTCELCRLAARCDRQFRRVRGGWMQSDRFAWLLHRSAADVLLAEPDRVRGAAKARLEQQRAREGAKAEAELWDAWEVLLDGPVGDLVAVMIGLDERSMQLRTTTPFVGIVGEERRAAALAGSKAA